MLLGVLLFCSLAYVYFAPWRTSVLLLGVHNTLHHTMVRVFVGSLVELDYSVIVIASDSDKIDVCLLLFTVLS